VVRTPNENKVAATFLVKTRDVIKGGNEWLEVYLPIRPNGSTAWVRATDVTVTFTDLQVVVGLSEHHLQVLQAGQPLLDLPAGIGRGETPTPGGVFYIKELLKPTNPDGAYGPAAFGLSGFSNALINSDQYPNGVIGIHGTNEPQLVGTDVSHGCIRLKNSDITKLVGLLPLGTPVAIDP
jgi:lipoprotein-anchoring transpeptidase ErfK/SrfK